MSNALVVFATRANKTKSIAEAVAEGMRSAGVEVTLSNVRDIKKESDLEGYDAVVLGSATYHGEMMQPMKTMLFLAEKADLQNKVGGSFGSFGWSGEAPGRIFDTMKNIFEMSMVSGPLRLKSPISEDKKKMAEDYGREIAEKLSGQ
jgi:flavorubredoxin